LELSPAAAAKTPGLFSGAAGRSIAGLFPGPDEGEQVSGGNRPEAEPRDYPLMPRFSSKRRVHHTAQQMFDLVADVERYPEFVPLCESLKIRQRQHKPHDNEILHTDE